jgi:Flp pilus assembly protein TadD
MGMALGKLGRDEEARKAYAKARELAQTGHK